jgi:hypothetical protein
LINKIIEKFVYFLWDHGINLIYFLPFIVLFLLILSKNDFKNWNNLNFYQKFFLIYGVIALILTTLLMIFYIIDKIESS